jgi:hypothetical protein
MTKRRRDSLHRYNVTSAYDLTIQRFNEAKPFVDFWRFVSY